MFCENCGYKIEDDIKFCENCGEPINKVEEVTELSYSEATEKNETYGESEFEEISKIKKNTYNQEINESKETAHQEEIKISNNIIMTSTGSYKWMYEFSLWKNPTVLISVYKILLIALLAPALLMFFLTIGDGIGKAFKLLVSMIGIGAVLISVLMIAGYVILSLAYGGKYYVLFKMDNKGINHIQLDKQHKKAQALGFLTAIIGASSSNISAAGAGLLAASKKSLYTKFKNVKSIKFNPSRNTIYLNESLNKNQIYIAKEDFQFVKQFILENCPKNIKIIKK